MKTVWTNLRRVFGEFCKSNRANVALTFGVAVIPVIGFIGAAVDYSRANSVKASLQAALDSTSLMISREVGSLSHDQLHDKSLAYFQALFTRPEATNVNITKWDYDSTNGYKVDLEVSADVPTTFIGILHLAGLNSVDTINVKGSSTAKWGNSRLRVALVLDNTGSMADAGKIDALKTATKNLLSQLQGAVKVDGDVYVSIVPFVKDVKIDPSDYLPASWDAWLRWDDGVTTADNFWDALNGTCSFGGKTKRSTCLAQASCSLSAYTTQATCQAAGTCSISGQSTQSGCTSAGVCSNPGQTTQNSCVNQNACTKSKWTTQSNCTSHSGIWGFGTWKLGVWTAGVWNPPVWTHKDHAANWNGCLKDRGSTTAPGTNADYDQKADQPDSTIPASLFPPEQYSSCPQPIMGLNSNWTAMNTAVDAMTPAGNTNQPIGLIWGWHTLAGVGPFSVPAFDSNYIYQQVIILLSDGLNTQDRWYTDQTSIDKRMYDSTTGLGTCANIKAAGIVIYTIQVNTGGDPTSTLLQGCASNTSGTTDHFYLLTTADQIIDTFKEIGTNLTKLRIAH